MIPRNYTERELLGRECRLMREAETEGGRRVPAGTLCAIADVVRGQGITIVTEPCPLCGRRDRLAGGDRNMLRME